MAFQVKIEPKAWEDIQDGIDWYAEQQPGLNFRFLDEVSSHIEILKENPFFQIRYDEVRCLPLKNFPFMIHYTVDKPSKQVIIRAVFHTSLDPEIWKKKK